jgi:hypothetical protein
VRVLIGVQGQKRIEVQASLSCSRGLASAKMQAADMALQWNHCSFGFAVMSVDEVCFMRLLKRIAASPKRMGMRKKVSNELGEVKALKSRVAT